MSETVPVPEEGAKDTLRSTVLGALEAIPGGGVMGAGLALMWTSSYQRRMQEFLADVDMRLRALELTQDQLEDLLTTERNVTAGLVAALAAATTGDENKRRLLGNALLNAVLAPQDAEAELQWVLFKLLDELTVTHVRVLQFLASPNTWSTANREPLLLSVNELGRYKLEDMLRAGIPAVTNAALAQGVVSGLESRGLLGASLGGDIEGAMFEDAQLENGVVSALGERLLQFVSWSGPT